MIARLILAVALAIAATPALPHDIYTGVYGKNGQLCCGGDDCAATTYRERGGAFEFLTREKTWVEIPAERITFLPIPGDPPNDNSHHAHLCYRPLTEVERVGIGGGINRANIFGDIYLFCAFIPPGGV